MKYWTNRTVSKYLHDFHASFYGPSRIRNTKNTTYALSDSLQKKTLEHIVPRSVCPSKTCNSTKDMHNLILYPEKLNTHRSNYKFVERKQINNKNKKTVLLDQYGRPISRASFDNNYAIKNTKQKTFSPIPYHRGVIARACAYMFYTYPFFKESLFLRVICPYTLIDWHQEHPACNYEKNRNCFIEEKQGNRNPFIDIDCVYDDLWEVIKENHQPDK